MLKQIVTAGSFLLACFSFPASAQFTNWSSPQKVASPINSAFLDTCTTISKNGLTLIFSSNRQTGNPASPDRDLYVSKRMNVNAPWQEPVPLTSLNTVGYWDSCPQLSLDEHRLYFTSNRPGSCGAEDLWVSRRHDRKDDLGWQAPVHPPCESEGGINGAGRDLTPVFFEDEEGKVIMYFTKSRAGTPFADNYQTEMRDDDTFGPATPVAELNGENFVSAYAVVRRDGLEVIFASNRPGGSGNGASLDLWSATRARTGDPWSNIVFLPMFGSSPAWTGGHMAFSFDGRELYFNSWAPGGYASTIPDIYVARREKHR
jgi:hypothetical protein